MSPPAKAPMAEANAGDPDDKPPAGYPYLREELRFEHTLLGGRMTYYLTSQSFLFTAAAVARGMHWRGWYWLSGCVLPLVGLVGSAVTLYVVYTAYGRMREWRALEQRYVGRHPLVVTFTAAQHRRSLLFSTLMPWVLAGVWVALAVLFHLLQPQAGGGM